MAKSGIYEVLLVFSLKFLVQKVQPSWIRCFSFFGCQLGKELPLGGGIQPAPFSSRLSGPRGLSHQPPWSWREANIYSHILGKCDTIQISTYLHTWYYSTWSNFKHIWVSFVHFWSHFVSFWANCMHLLSIGQFWVWDPGYLIFSLKISNPVGFRLLFLQCFFGHQPFPFSQLAGNEGNMAIE